MKQMPCTYGLIVGWLNPIHVELQLLTTAFSSGHESTVCPDNPDGIAGLAITWSI